MVLSMMGGAYHLHPRITRTIIMCYVFLSMETVMALDSVVVLLENVPVGSNWI